jgi:AAA ATPase domain
MVANPFIPLSLVGRQAELNQVCQILEEDSDLLVAGVPGSGRRTLVRAAAERVGARIIQIDCLRATHTSRFLQLLAEAILAAFDHAAELALIQQWSTRQPVVLEGLATRQARLIWHSPADEWTLFKSLLALPQAIAEALDSRVVIVFQNFPHIRSWDRAAKWESYLRQEIQYQSRVSYALIATVAESWVRQSDMQVIFLAPIKPEDLQPWLIHRMASQGLALESSAVELFVDYVQGNFGDAIALAKRVWEDFRLEGSELESPLPSPSPSESVILPATQIQNPKPKILSHHIHRATLALVEDLALTFESLLLLLPSSQVRVLESLALDPTDSPHSREYIQKHHLSRGGGLQGALASLEQKGLVYGADYNYRITMPFLAFWLKNRLA